MTFEKTNKAIATAALSLAGAGIAAIFASQPAAAQYYYAQPYGQQQVYPYVVVQQPYAPQPQSYPYVVQQPQGYAAQPRHIRVKRRAAAPPRETHRHIAKADPALIEELRQRASKATGKKFDKTVIVREPPVVVERKRYVDDPPVVIRRHKIVDVNVPGPESGPGPGPAPRARGGEGDRVIRAEAEVTILGPDRMTIRLFRKGTEANAKAQ